MRRKGRRSSIPRRPSRRTRKSLLLVFALLFAAGGVRRSPAECIQFTPPPAISITANGARSVATGDIDQDGDLDVLSASFEDDKLAWYANNGAGGGWAIHTISQLGNGATSVVAADIDG